VEAGQGEVWVLLASPCGTDAEGDGDAGLSALVAFATAAGDIPAGNAGDVSLEPWVTPDGVGLLAHGPPRDAEGPRAHARRLADAVGRAFASGPAAPKAIARARAQAARLASPAFAELASALAPRHPTWIAPFGREDVTLRASDAAVLARAEALRSGPLRLATLANTDEAQGDAALLAVDRWAPRRATDAPRACPTSPPRLPARPGTYAARARPGALPEAWLAYPLAPDGVDRDAAELIAAALDGRGGLLEKALGGASPTAVAESAQARVVGYPRAPALVIRLTARDAELDGAVLQARALVDRVRAGGLVAVDHERGGRALARAAVQAALDPRARLVATFRGEPIARAERLPTLDRVRQVAAHTLVEDAMVVVAARPPRGSGP
jgi:hypothetical protein